MLFLYIIGAVLSVSLLFWVLNLLTRKSNKLTPLDFSTRIENHIAGNEGPWDWEYLVTTPLADKRLEPIRELCLEVGDPPLTPEKLEQLRGLIVQLRGME